MNEPQVLEYSEFERNWLRRHRSSIPRRAKIVPIQEAFWILFWLVVAAGAAIYSAAHTVPAAEMTFFKTIAERSSLANAAFIIVEFVIFGAAAKRHEIKWLKYLLGGVLIVALSGNIGSSVTAVAENGGTALNQLGGIMLAIIAPFTAFAAGEVLHRQLQRISERVEESKQLYKVAMRETEATINREYTKYVKSQGGKVSPPVHEISREFHEIPGEIKPRVKLHEVAREIHENGDVQLSTSEMMNKYGISLGSTTKVREILKSQNGSHD